MDNKQKKISRQIGAKLTVLNMIIIAAVCAGIYFLGFKGSISLKDGAAAALVLIAAVCVTEYLYLTYSTKKLVVQPIDRVRDELREYMDSGDGKAVRERLDEIDAQNEIMPLIGELSRLTLRTDEHIRGINEEKLRADRLMEDVMSALAAAIDAKDKYTRGHSARVAGYARKIAELSGKSQEECRMIYYAGLLHDVGKIGVPESIINKKGKLTDEEYRVIKQHSVMGAQILQSIKESPELAVAARHHHERYDGNGYPDGLKGTDIPEMARIISVADAYDAMTSMRSYRAPIPQQTVREELVKGAGTQFDPEYAKIMLKMIDMDIEYEMIEGIDQNYLDSEDELIIDSHRSDVSPGINITSYMSTIHITIKPYDRSSGVPARPSLILYNALDGQVHTDAKDMKDLEYFEYGEIWFDGNTNTLGARKMQVTAVGGGNGKDNEYLVEAVKYKEHVLIRIQGKTQTFEVITALPDDTRFLHIAFTGEHCSFTSVSTEQAEEQVSPDYIPRIVEEVSYINDVEGDIPNVQVDGYRMTASQGVPIEDGMKMTFHAVSHPNARRVWHCPYVNVFAAQDGKVFGTDYHDYMLMRLDGECWGDDPASTVTSAQKKSAEFTGWEKWRELCKAGFECVLEFERRGDRITVRTENGGIFIEATAEISGSPKTVYAALTGDHCTMTNIRLG